MSNKIISGIDVGTHAIKIVVTEQLPDGQLRVLGTGVSTSDGMHHGYIMDSDRVVHSIKRALDNVVKNANIRPAHAYVSIGGASLGSTTMHGGIPITSPESRITEYDLERVITDANKKAESQLINQKIIHEIPIRYHLDGKPALSRPLGLRAARLETPVLFIHALERHIDDFISVVERAGVEVLDVTASPLAASFATLSAPQKMQGCILVDIGAESTDVILFENNTPLTLAVIPMGSNDITNKLAVELKITTLEAENSKRTPTGGKEQKAIEKIIDRSLTDIFSEVKKIITEKYKHILLPGGVLITGGGSHILHVTDIAKKVLGLPARTIRASTPGVDHAPELTVAYGLCVWGSSDNDTDSFSAVKQSMKKVSGWFKQFLP